MLNKYSCMLDVAAELLEEDVESIAKEIGICGDEIIWPDLPDPFRRRGFHIHDLRLLFLTRGYALVDFDPTPVLKTQGSDKLFEISFDIQNILLTYNGLLIIKKHQAQHAIVHYKRTRNRIPHIIMFYAMIPITNQNRNLL